MSMKRVNRITPPSETCSCNTAPAPIPDHQRERDRRNAVGERTVQRLDPHRTHLYVAIARVDRAVPFLVVFLPLRQLHYLQAREVLLQVLVQSRHRLAHQPEQLPRNALERVGDAAHDRHHQQHDHGQLHVDREHDHEGHEERHELADQGADAAQQFVQRFDVVGNARHDAADCDAVVKRRRARFEMPEQVDAQIAQTVDHRADQREPVIVPGDGPAELQHGEQTRTPRRAAKGRAFAGSTP